jgi:tripartite motif-containing protein 71
LSLDSRPSFGSLPTVAPDGSFWTGEQLGERIQKFDSKMRFLGKWESKGTGPGQYSHGIFGIAFGAKGRIWTVDNGGDRLEIYDSKVRFIGQSGHNGTGPGDFEFPSYMAMDAQGDLYVVETGGGRIQSSIPSSDGHDLPRSSKPLRGRTLNVQNRLPALATVVAE